MRDKMCIDEKKCVLFYWIIREGNQVNAGVPQGSNLGPTLFLL